MNNQPGQPEEPSPTQGTLKVNMAGTSEGRWSIDDGSTWHAGGHSLNLAPDDYTVIFKAVEGYETPVNENATITIGQTTTINVTYEEDVGGQEPEGEPNLRVSGTGSVHDGDYTYLSGEGYDRVWEKAYTAYTKHRIAWNEMEDWIIIDYTEMGGEWEYDGPPDYNGHGTDPWTASWDSMWGGDTPTVTQITGGNGNDNGNGATSPYSNIEVTGVDVLFDGIYTYTEGEGDNRKWIKADSENAQHRIYMYDGEWALEFWYYDDWEEEWTPGQGDYFYATNSDVDHPWEATGWRSYEYQDMPTLTPVTE